MKRIVLVRHGETEWSATGRHTGRTDVPLTAEGERAARGLGQRLRELGVEPVRCITSPRYLGFPPSEARHLALATASLSLLGHEHHWRALHLWNERAGD